MLPGCSSRRFQWLSVTFDRFTGRQYCPLPSMTPSPVMEMFSALSALMGDWQRRVSSPSNEVFTSG